LARTLSPRRVSRLNQRRTHNFHVVLAKQPGQVGSGRNGLELGRSREKVPHPSGRLKSDQHATGAFPGVRPGVWDAARGEKPNAAPAKGTASALWRKVRRGIELMVDMAVKIYGWTYGKASGKSGQFDEEEGDGRLTVFALHLRAVERQDRAGKAS
jgi:hypothetical protein